MFSIRAVLGFVTWILLFYTLLHALLRKKVGAGFMPIHLMDTISVFIFATIHGGIILYGLLANGYGIKLFAILGIITWALCTLVLLLGIFRKQFAALLKRAYIPVHIVIATLAFLVATTHGGMLLYRVLTTPPPK